MYYSIRAALFGIILLFTSNSLAFKLPFFGNNDSDYVVNGSASYNNRELDSATINGSLKFNKLTVKDSLLVNGSCNGKNLVANDVTVNGNAKISDVEVERFEVRGSLQGKNINVTDEMIVSGNVKVNTIKVQGDLEIAGRVDIDNGSLHRVELSGKKLSLKNSTAKSITISGSGVQTLRLNNSTISGDVIFDSGKGKVRLINSKISGKLAGGEVVSEDNDN